MKWFRPERTDPGPQRISPADASLTFRERVERFWAWWSDESDRLLAAVDSDGGGSIQVEVSEAVNQLCPNLGWVFGPGADDEGHSFTLSPEGDATKRFLVRHWCAKAPQLRGWTFYPSRQPSADFGKTSIRIGEVELGADSLWITPSIEVEHENIDITAWSPTFADISREQAMQILFLYLDEALGEDGTERSIGSIDLGDGKLDRSIPLTELPEYVDRVFAEQGWEKGEMAWSSYQVEKPLGDFPRGDIFVGSTQSMGLVGEYFDQRGPVDNPVAGTGADLMFMQLARVMFPDGGEVEFRGEIEDALVESFGVEFGHVTGGAMGTDAGYIDLILFDGSRSRQRIDEVMEGRGLAGQYQLFPFVK